MKTSQVTKTSIINTIDFMMAQTGISREQAIIALHTIGHFLHQYSSEPYNKLVNILRAARNRDSCTMN